MAEGNALLSLTLLGWAQKGREYMSKKKKNKINGSFTVIEHNLINSEAWKGLKTHTKWLFFEFKFRFYGDNKKHIIFTYKEAKNIMAINTFINDRKQLIERGFIDVTKRGGLEKQRMIYGLSERWRKYGTKDFEKKKIEDVLPKIYKTGFEKGNKLGRQSKK